MDTPETTQDAAYALQRKLLEFQAQARKKPAQGRGVVGRPSYSLSETVKIDVQAAAEISQSDPDPAAGSRVGFDLAPGERRDAVPPASFPAGAV